MSVIEEIRGFIVENFLFGDESREPGPDDSLYGKGIVDSTGVLSIINYIEERYGIAVSDTEITPENLDSINRISAFIGRKTGDADEV